MAAGERWARPLSHKYLTLDVFAINRRARDIYGRLGYREDTVKIVKPLDDVEG